MLWPISTDRGMQVTIRTDAGVLELGSFIAAYGCDGPVARLVKRNLPNITRAMLDPTAARQLRTYLTTGISVSNLLTMAREANRRQNAGSVPPRT